MNKAYTRINWENEPSDATPLNETNLNRMDAAINEIDTRVVTMDTTKLSVTTANTMVKDVAFNETTGVFTITKLNGSVVTINTALEKIATNFVYNKTTQKLILTLIDGTTQEVDLTALLTQYEFLDSDTIAFTISSDGKVTASVKNGSITGDKLEPNYLADVTLQANNAKDSADNAKTSEELAYQYAEEARESASQAQVNNAANITYDNSISGLSATNVKDALDEVAQGSDSALKDGDGNVITSTYAKKSIYDNNAISYGRKVGSTVGEGSIAFGLEVEAPINYGVAVGAKTRAGDCAFACGHTNSANGLCSSASGFNTTVDGEYSHVEGVYTKASSNCQHVQGKYNVEDTEHKYAHIIGGGNSETDRKNIHTIDWDGNADFAGEVKCSNVLKTVTECEASTKDTDIASAMALGELKESLTTPEYNVITLDAYNMRVRYRKILNIAELDIESTNYNLPANANITLCTLPEGYRPKDRSFPFPEGYNLQTTNSVHFYLGKDGSLILQNYGTTEARNPAGHCTYFV